MPTPHRQSYFFERVQYRDADARRALSATTPIDYDETTGVFSFDGGAAGGVITHGTLLGLSADDHAQYLLLAGRGGQTISDTIEISTGLTVGAAGLDASALFELDSTTLGALLPRMTTVERDAIVAPATGLILFDTTVGDLMFWDGAAWQTIGSIGFPGVSDHGGLTGLLDDDHTQYLLLAGRAGGQTAYGGTAASEVLTFGGTAHATVGSVRLGAGTYYADLDETIGRLTLHYSVSPVGGLYLESALFGADRAARIQAAHRSSATPITMVIGTSLATTTELEWGGGSGVEYAATHHRFYAAANTTTVTGTEMMRLDLGGLVIDANGVSGDAASLLEIRGATTPAAQITWETTSSYGQLNFYESGTKRGGIQAIGSAFATAARRNDLELTTNTAGGRISFLPGAAGHMATIDATGMGIGLASTVDPRVKFEVALDANTLPVMSANTAIVASNASAGGDSANIAIIAGAAGASSVHFGDTASETAGVVQYNHATDTFAFMASSGSVIGYWSTAGLSTIRATPGAALDIALDVNTLPALSASTAIVASNASAAGDAVAISLIAGATGSSNFYFGDTLNEDAGAIAYDHTTDVLSFAAALTTRLSMGAGYVAVGDGTTACELRLFEASGAQYTGFTAPALAASVIYTLPTADASTADDVLTSNAAGTLAWKAGGDLRLARIGASTYFTIADMQTLFHSAGWSSGGTITDAGGGNVNVAAGTGWIRAADAATSTLLFFDHGASAGIAIPAAASRWIGVEYNAGAPQIVTKTTDDFDARTDYRLGFVVNDGTTLHITIAPHAVTDHAGQMIERDRQTMPLARDEITGGLELGETGTRNITMSAGALWEGLTRFAITAFDSSALGTFDRYYQDGVGGWTIEAAQTQWTNTAYDDGSGVLATMTANRYAILWFYVELDADVTMVYGRAQYTTATAAEQETPPTVPPVLERHGRLIGRLIFQKSAASATEIQSAWATVFTTGTADHGALGGLTDDDHTQYLLLAGRGGQTISDTIEISTGLTVGAAGLDTSAIFELDSTTLGALMPRMTTVQRDAIGAPATGLLIFDLTTGDFEVWDGAAWTTVGAAAGAHDILSATHTDTLAAAVVRGDLLVGNVTPAWSRLALGTTGYPLVAGATDPSWAQIDHGGAITGLLDDDHTQYLLLVGRAGGQTVYGGTAAGDDLTLSSTSDVTLGTVFVGAGLAVDDTLGFARVGLPVVTPAAPLHIAVDAGTPPALSGNTGLVLVNASAAGDSVSAALITGVTGTSSLFFGSTADEDAGRIDYAQATQAVSFSTGATERMRLNSTGLVINVGGVASAPTTLLELRQAATPDARLVWTDTSSAGSVTFYEDGAEIASIQATGTLYGVTARRTDLELATTTAGARISFSPGAGGHMATIDATGVAVGLGLAVDPRVKFEVALDTNTLPSMDASTAIVASNASATTDDVAIALISGATGQSRIHFGNTANEDAGIIAYENDGTDTLITTVATTPITYLTATGLSIGGSNVQGTLALAGSSAPSLQIAREAAGLLNGSALGYIYVGADESTPSERHMAVAFETIARETWAYGTNNCGGALRIYTTPNATRTRTLALTIDQDQGLWMTTATGGSKGSGTINAAGDIYKNGTAFTNPDYVLRAWNGRPDLSRAEDRQYHGIMPLDSFLAHMRAHDRLPGIDDEPCGAFGRLDKLLEKIEEMAIYIGELHARLAAVEGRK